MFNLKKAKNNVREFLEKETNRQIENASNIGKQEVSIWLDADYSLIEEVVNKLDREGYKTKSDPEKTGMGYELHVSWK